jgi:hypothetical protein
MNYATWKVPGMALAILSLACGPTDTPLTAVEGGSVASLSENAGPPLLPAWVTHPEAFPKGLEGRNNCTFAFGQTIPQWDFHPDAGCWERPGPDGWTRQQQHLLHVPQLPSCGGGAADVSPIRVCREGGAGQESPCPGLVTGPNGCALCVRVLACH